MAALFLRKKYLACLVVDRIYNKKQEKKKPSTDQRISMSFKLGRFILGGGK